MFLLRRRRKNLGYAYSILLLIYSEKIYFITVSDTFLPNGPNCRSVGRPAGRLLAFRRVAFYETHCRIRRAINFAKARKQLKRTRGREEKELARGLVLFTGKAHLLQLNPFCDTHEPSSTYIVLVADCFAHNNLASTSDWRASRSLRLN